MRTWHLAVDQASNNCGISLWKNGDLVAVTTLKSKSSKDPFSKRIQDQILQLDVFLADHLANYEKINTVIFEGVRSRLVLCTVGSFMTSKYLYAGLHAQHSFVESTAWKKYSRDRGATGPIADVKGIKSLKEIGFPTDKYNITTEDEADSVMIYLTWKERKKHEKNK